MVVPFSLASWVFVGLRGVGCYYLRCVSRRCNTVKDLRGCALSSLRELV